MSNLNVTGPGPELKLAIGTPPAASAAGTVNGTGVDRTGFCSCVLESVTGALTGAPATQTQDVKLQDSADNISFADFAPAGTGSGAVAQITSANTRKRKSINLAGARQYIRAVTAVAFTGGTSPTMGSYAALILGAADKLAAQADD